METYQKIGLWFFCWFVVAPLVFGVIKVIIEDFKTK